MDMTVPEPILLNLSTENQSPRSIVVTGSSRGIGSAIAQRFAREGWYVGITYNSHESEAQGVAAKCRLWGAHDVGVWHLDVTDLKSCEALRDQVASWLGGYGKLDVFVNNAGVYLEKNLSLFEDAEIQRIVDVNLKGLIRMTRVMFPHFKTGIVNIGSQLGTQGIEQQNVYAASKWGVRGFSKSLAPEWLKPDAGGQTLQVWQINPDETATHMTAFSGRPPQQVADVVWQAVNGRYGKHSGEDHNVWELLGERKA